MSYNICIYISFVIFELCMVISELSHSSFICSIYNLCQYLNWHDIRQMKYM